MKQLNIKYLAKGMRVEDKAKLMFADRDKRAETNNKEWILTPEEEDALTRDAQELKQINELNKLFRLWNASGLMVVDIQTAYLNFLLAEEKVEGALAAIVIVGEQKDRLQRAIRDWSFEGYTDEQLEDPKIQTEVNQKGIDLRKKYFADSTSTDSLDYFSPPLKEENYFSVGTLENLDIEPNIHLQKLFMEVVKRIKHYKRQIYMCNYLSQMAGFELLGDKQKETIEDFDKDINEFINLESPFGLIKIYSDLAEKGLVKTTNLTEPKFMESLKDMILATSLSEQEQQETQKEITGIIERTV